MSFPCTRCGLCCQHIDQVAQLQAYDRGNGTCIHYRTGIGCAVYDQRPVVCRIDDGYQVFASDHMSRTEYYGCNAQVCNQLQEAAGFSPDWRVVL